MVSHPWGPWFDTASEHYFFFIFFFYFAFFLAKIWLISNPVIVMSFPVTRNLFQNYKGVWLWNFHRNSQNKKFLNLFPNFLFFFFIFSSYPSYQKNYFLKMGRALTLKLMGHSWRIENYFNCWMFFFFSFFLIFTIRGKLYLENGLPWDLEIFIR